MNTTQKYLCLFTFIAVLLCSCASYKNGTNDLQTNNADTSFASENSSTISLPYYSNDVLNPYTAVSKSNQELCKLMFDPLVKLSSSFEPEFYLIDDLDTTGLKLTLTLTDAKMTDGSQLCADDVVYSVEAAKKKGSNYYQKVENISSCRAKDSSSVVITLKENDPYFINNLDIPIIKNGTGNKKDKNNRVTPPIGCGRYTLKLKNGTYSLNANKNYYKNIVKLKIIRLVDCPDQESYEHILSSGGISMAYSDLADANIPTISGKRIEIPLNNLVYLGINSANSKYTNNSLRQLLNCVIDRNAISNSAYYGNAIPATGLFNPKWRKAANKQSMPELQNKNKAIAYLDELGYNSLDADGYYINRDNNRLKFTLLYNNGNSSRVAAAQLIKEQLKSCGIDVILDSQSNSGYRQTLDNGNYDLYIGEVKIPQSMNVNRIFSKNNVVYGISKKSETASIVKSYYSKYSKKTIEDIAVSFENELPFIPLCYRNGVMIYHSRISKLSSNISDIYSGLESISIN